MKYPMKQLQHAATDVGLIVVVDGTGVLFDEMLDITVAHTPTEIAKIGVVLSQLGSHYTEMAREIVMETIGYQEKIIDSGVVFEHQSASKQTRVNSALIRKHWPPQKHPALYKPVARKESVAISLEKKD